jgi:hypothetical protein
VIDGTNARLVVDALAPLVERICPTTEEVHGDVPLERVPAHV